MVRGVTLIPLALVCGLLAGCSKKSDSNPQSAPSPSSSASASGTPGGSATPSPSGSAAPATLPETCADVLTLDELDAAAGKPMPGQTLYIKGQAEPKIKRTGRVTCRYGVHKGLHTPVFPLEIGVSAYSDAESATNRIQFTINDQRNQGATPTEITLGDNVKGTLLISANASLAVFAKGTATVAITLAKDSGISGGAAKDPLTKIATAVAAHLP
jgi:hypothetical protein